MSGAAVIGAGFFVQGVAGKKSADANAEQLANEARIARETAKQDEANLRVLSRKVFNCARTIGRISD